VDTEFPLPEVKLTKNLSLILGLLTPVHDPGPEVHLINMALRKRTHKPDLAL